MREMGRYSAKCCRSGLNSSHSGQDSALDSWKGKIGLFASDLYQSIFIIKYLLSEYHLFFPSYDSCTVYCFAKTALNIKCIVWLIWSHTPDVNVRLWNRSRICGPTARKNSYKEMDNDIKVSQKVQEDAKWPWQLKMRQKKLQTHAHWLRETQNNNKETLNVNKVITKQPKRALK